VTGAGVGVASGGATTVGTGVGATVGTGVGTSVQSSPAATVPHGGGGAASSSPARAGDAGIAKASTVTAMTERAGHDEGWSTDISSFRLML
jgi:hypothetical protein